MIAAAVLSVALAQGAYVRSRVDDTSTTSPCLYWTENTNLIFHQSALGNPETPGDTEFAAVTASFATWQQQFDTCGSLTLSEGARSTSRTVGYVETSRAANENLVLFRQQSCSGITGSPAVVSKTDACWKADTCGSVYDCWDHSSAAIAITTTSYNPVAGNIYDSDIELNTPSFVFSTVDSPACAPGHYAVTCVATDVQNTVTHEVGHVLGLAHINLSSSTMNPRADPGELSKRVLDPGSKQFVCDAYPKGKPSVSAVSNACSGVLGSSAGGCASAPGLTLGLLVAPGLLLRRRRQR